MAVPNFTAERSLYHTSAHYRGIASFGRVEGTVQLAQDPGCLARCQNSCVPGCFDLVGTARGACLRLCRLECLEVCPPLPPPPSPCPQGWRWVSGPFNCPTCCRDLGGGL